MHSLCFAVRIKQRRGQLIQCTDESHKAAVYCISQNQVLGQFININVRHTYIPDVFIC